MTEDERAAYLIAYLRELSNLDSIWHTEELMKSIQVTTKEIEKILIEK